MEKCLHSPKSRRECWIGLIMFLSVAALLALIGGLVVLEDPNNLSMGMLMFATGLLICFIGMVLYIVLSCEYSVDPVGITVSYCSFYEIRHLWSNIESVSICDIHHATKNQNVFDFVIRIVEGEEKRGPFNKDQRFTWAGYERWRTFGYSLLHLDKIIILEYSEERYNTIQRLSGKTIYDFRTAYARSRTGNKDT